ncbi:signal peptide peptidase-domain-containing protein [Russula aff. rugulosa BPL654]|nr:signal peptide peptidase-domain-containing protein [Russula aff. rugulosa BPL654]
MPEASTSDLLVAYAGVLTTATISIYAGSYESLPVSPPSKPKDCAKSSDNDGEDEDDSSTRLTAEDAWLFPLLGSVLLVGLFLVLKYLGKEWINWLMSLYFGLAGLYSVPYSLISLARFTLGIECWSQFTRSHVKVSLNDTHISRKFRLPSLFLAPLGMIPSAYYILYYGPDKPILLTNILALSFGHGAMSMLKLDSFKTGSILLSGLFFYDIWWVFGTKVMVSVATSLDLPMKILWPKSKTFSMENGSMMLGLGDIVVPGTFISLALRYDHFRHTKAHPSAGTFTRPYFIASLVAYVAGLATTMGVMHVFHSAQPALLYLSPACILSFVFTAWRRGELIEAWRWNDGVSTTSKNGDVQTNYCSDAAGGGASSSDPSDAVKS